MFPVVSVAEEETQINAHLEGIAGEYAECAAYYELMYYAMKSSKEDKIADKYKKQEDSAMLISQLLAGEGRSKDMALNVTNSRIDMYMKKMKQETDNRNGNKSILIKKYHFHCNEIMVNPPIEVSAILQR